MLLYGKVFALYWSGFWYCTAVCCNLCSWYLIGTSLDFVVVYRGHCNFVKRRKNRTIWFSLYQISLKLLFLVCISFCLCPRIFPPHTWYPSLCTCLHLMCCVYFIFLLTCTLLVLACPIRMFLLRYSVVPSCVLAVSYCRLSFMVTEPRSHLCLFCLLALSDRLTYHCT